jgi:dGTPase
VSLSPGEPSPGGTYSEHDTQRWVAEPAKRSGRTHFQRDRARVLHSSALRRLAAKTQVVRAGSGDFPRTRLTHSLECAQIGRELGAALGCDPDLVDAACLAHDIGHPPFGHNGENALSALASPGGALECGGFEGNAQSLRLLTRLEPKVPGAGLNLTRAALDAALKYPWVYGRAPAGARPGLAADTGGEPSAPEPPGKCGAYLSDLPVFEWIRQGAPAGRRCLEAQVMDWADDVAYSVHDVEDGLHAGLVPLAALFSPAERSVVAGVALDSYCDPSWAASRAELEEVFAAFLAQPFWDFTFDGGLAALAAVKNLASELVGRFCGAAEQATPGQAAGAGHRVARPGVAGPGAAGLRRYAAGLVVPRRELLECALLKGVALHYVMRREGAAAQQAGEREVIAELALAIYDGAPDAFDPVLRPAWADAGPAATGTASGTKPEMASETERRRVVIDQVASLTDRSAIVWHRRLCA